MDIRLTVILAFAVFFAAATSAVFISKKYRSVFIITALALIPAAFVAQFAATKALEEPQTEKETQTQALGRDELLEYVNALISGGMTNSASDVLKEYSSTYPIDEDYLTAESRIKALEGNYGAAVRLMPERAVGLEIFGIGSKTETDAIENAEKGVITHEEMSRVIMDAAGKLGVSQKIKEIAQIYAESDNLYAFDPNAKEEASSLADLMRDKLENGKVRLPKALERGYLKLLVAAGKYEEIAERTINTSDPMTLIVLGELTRLDKIKSSDVNGIKELNEKNEQSKTVSEWLRKAAEELDSGERELVIEAAEELDDSIVNGKKAYKIWVRTSLVESAEDEGNTEAAKTYLELAKMDLTDGNEDSASENIKKALQKASDSEDRRFAGPAVEINEVIKDKSDTEGLKKIDDYVDKLIDNMGSKEMNSGYGRDGGTSDLKEAVINEITEENPPEDFKQYVSSEVSQSTASISVSSVDPSEFEKITAVIAVDESIATTPEEFKNKVELIDCGNVIKNFTVEKLGDAKVNIVLVCDNSGSMAGDKITNLKSAVSTFADTLTDDVSLGIVSFDSGVLGSASAPIGSSASALKSAINAMGAYGGTNIYSGVSSAIGQLKASEDLNVIIVMSDGQDARPSADIMNSIKSECNARNTVIYTMGLGYDVDSSVLSAYSSSGGGSYTFVSDSGSLLSFYNYLYQTSRNRFRVKYEALDTIKTSRSLRASYKDDPKVYGTREYYVPGYSEISENDLGEEYDVVIDGVSLNGLDTRLLFRSSVPQTIRLLGDKLDKSLDVSVTITSGVSYELACAYESETSRILTVPANAACGEYDVIVNIGDKRAVFDSGLVIASKDLETIRFGQYVFESSQISDLGDEVVMNGYTRMNGWLEFSGPVKLSGDRNTSNSLRMNSGQATVSFDRNDPDVKGVASTMAEHGRMIGINGIYDLNIYRNEGIPSSADTFRADPSVLYAGLVVQNLFELNTPGLSLYPDRMEIGFNDFTTAFPFQDKLLKSGGLDKIFAFKSTHQETIIVSQKAVDCKFELGVESSDKDAYREAKFGNMRLLVNLEEFKLSIDTKEDNYSVKTAVNIAMLGKGIGLELAWKAGGLDKAKIYADFDVDTVICGVPTTFSDFSLGASGIAGDGLKSLTLEGGCKISFVKVSDKWPGLEKYLGDVSVLSLDDVELKFRFYTPYISLSAKLKFIEKVEIGHASIMLGSDLPYTNDLIGITGGGVNGIVGEVGTGIKYQSPGENVDIDIGASGELALTNVVCGFTVKGNIKVIVKWWLLEAIHVDASGRAFFGFFVKNNGHGTFALYYQLNGNKIEKPLDWDTGRVIA